jgi:hypothetical protein
MPIIVAIVGAVVTGLFYWLIWGRGLDYIEHRWRASSDRRRETRRRGAALEQRRLAPLRTVSDARDAAIVLMLTVARQRGVPTPEQIAVVERSMREVLGFAGDVTERLTAATFIADQVAPAEDAVDHLAPLLAALPAAPEHDPAKWPPLRRIRSCDIKGIRARAIQSEAITLLSMIRRSGRHFAE